MTTRAEFAEMQRLAYAVIVRADVARRARDRLTFGDHTRAYALRSRQALCAGTLAVATAIRSMRCGQCRQSPRVSTG